MVVCGVVGKVGGKLVLLSEFENQADFPCSLHGLEFGWGFGFGWGLGVGVGRWVRVRKSSPTVGRFPRHRVC